MLAEFGADTENTQTTQHALKVSVPKMMLKLDTKRKKTEE